MKIKSINTLHNGIRLARVINYYFEIHQGEPEMANLPQELKTEMLQNDLSFIINVDVDAACGTGTINQCGLYDGNGEYYETNYDIRGLALELCKCY